MNTPQHTMKNEEVYETKCSILREDLNIEVEADVIRFRPNQFLKVVIGNSVIINLQYEPSYHGYIGTKSKMNFLSKGPVRLK